MDASMAAFIKKKLPLLAILFLSLLYNASCKSTTNSTLKETKLNDNEIFITNLLHEVGIISPDSFYTNVKFNNNNSIKMIFQDMDYTEILRRNRRVDGIVIAENKTKNNTNRRLWS